MLKVTVFIGWSGTLFRYDADFFDKSVINVDRDYIKKIPITFITSNSAYSKFK